MSIPRTKKTFHQRDLPHLQPIGGTFFVTYNLADAIPRRVLNNLSSEFETQKKRIQQISLNPEVDLDNLAKKYFAIRDKYLDLNPQGSNSLKIETIAQIVYDSLLFWNGKYLEMYCFCIMSNHVHAVFRLFDKPEVEKPKFLEEIMQSIKRFSAYESNKLLNRTGHFWQVESYDRWVRNDDELHRIMAYVLNNPVKANLCEKPFDWKWTFLNERFKKIFE
ncbi:hypothetical protein EGI22_01640 [Lacihabitans sp. LS3-19]|uniref:transposase n=1 Tax=Lacihabitans sp. LS3-19 TaxID=2487335 RepID=UPI0020CDB271|nr:transposase [Lacihabitans sp. LS3-19]MCP9766591.1 hypothetical protein [Lacihabitans sp. LS3-19]